MNSSGSIVRRVWADGQRASYAAVYRAGGKQRWKWFRRRKDAQRFLAKTLGEIHAGRYRDVRPTTFSAFAAPWIEGLGDLKPSTVEVYRSMLHSALVPFFGPKGLETITPDVVNGFLQQQAAAGLRVKTIKNQLALLSTILSAAVEAGRLGVNRLVGSKTLRRPRAVKAEDGGDAVEVFTPAQVNALLDALPAHYVPLVQTWVSTGLRPGEVVGLRVGDIDWTHHVLHVQRTHWHGVDYVPKTKGSRRTVDIGDQLLGVLGGAVRARFSDGVADLTTPLFVTPTGARIDLGRFRRGIWMAALAKAGLAYRRPYILRHTFASLVLAQGQSVAYVSAQLGHSSPMMTMNVYGRFLPRERRESPNRLEAQFTEARANGALTGLADLPESPVNRLQSGDGPTP
jgi:integrase